MCYLQHLARSQPSFLWSLALPCWVGLLLFFPLGVTPTPWKRRASKPRGSWPENGISTQANSLRGEPGKSCFSQNAALLILSAPDQAPLNLLYLTWIWF